MNRTLVVLALVLGIAAAASAQLAQQPAPAVAARLAALDPAGALRVSSLAADGTLRRLAGPLPLQGADLPARAADFVARFAPLFGADDAVVFGAARELQPRADGTPRALRLPQTAHGWEVDGAGLTLALDADGRALVAHGFVDTAAARLPAPVVTEQTAILVALAYLGLDPAALRGSPRVRGAVKLGAGGPVLVQRVGLIVRAGLLPLEIDVDAASAAVLSVRENRTDAKGNITLGDTTFLFPLTNGSGTAYASVAKALAAAESNTSLASLTSVDISPDDLLIVGTLTGRYCTVAGPSVLFSPPLIFPFADTSTETLDPQDPESPLIGECFDQSNAYAWITRTAKAFTKIMGTLPSDTCVPVIVNVEGDDGGNPVGFYNAFFTPESLGEPFAPGLMVFGDFDVDTGDLMDDFSRDPTVVAHEYFHCASAFAGVGFGAANLDNPPRAVNEAIADYAAATMHKTPLMGEVFAAHSGTDMPDGPDIVGSLRDLSQGLTVEDDLQDVLGQTGLPEEHEAGEIFGCALWRLRTTAKSKRADDIIINHLADWPQSTAEVGFPVVNVGNAAAAYEAYYLECFVAMINAAFADKGWKDASKVLGAFLAHGITGSAPSNVVVLDTTEKTAISFSSAFLGTSTAHAMALSLVEGQQITIKLTGVKGGATGLVFEFLGGPAPLEFTAPLIVNAEGTKLIQKGIVVAETGIYTLALGTAGAPGDYKAVIKIK